ncbi:hypothetical protein EN766_40265 [Mesorhizobium sp. M2A.F.Ca.ET.046.02.1.1]|nr:hypothetical protein EN766_40265 [Mesorhizobium sp. M2A.F.Ca.ET.046.02.1.1]
MPALGDAQQTERACFAKRIAHRGRPDAGAIADFLHRSVASAMLPAVRHDDVKRRALPFSERAGELWPDSLHAGETPLAPPPHRISVAAGSLAPASLAARALRITGARQRCPTGTGLFEIATLSFSLLAKPLRIVLDQRLLAVELPYLPAKIVQLGQ